MSNVKTIVDELRKRGLSNGTCLGYHSGLMDEAADIIESQQAEIERLKKFIENPCDFTQMFANADIITTQQAEIERLNGAVQEWVDGKCLSQKHLLMIGKLQNEIEQAKAEAIEEFAERVTQTLGMLNAKELAGADDGYDDIYYQQNPLAWTRGSATARNEAIAIISNTRKEMVGAGDNCPNSQNPK